jgi:hypothetical protein
VLEWLNKKFDERLISLFILFIFNILIYFDFIILYRLKIFLLVLLLIYIYIEFINFFEKFLKLKYEESEVYYLNNNYNSSLLSLNKLFNIFFNIYIYKNLILYFLMKLEIKLFFFFRKINYIFIKLPLLSKLIYISIMFFFIIPLKIILSVYYEFLLKLRKYTIIELFLKRFDGFIISLLFISDFIDYFFYYFKYFLFILNLNSNFFIFYLFLLCYLLLLIIIFLFEFINDWDERFNSWYTKHINLNILFFNRIQTTFFGIFIQTTLKFFVKINFKINLNENYLCLIDYNIIQLDGLIVNYLKNICDENIFMSLRLKSNFYNIMCFMRRTLKEYKNKPCIQFYEFYLNRNISNFNFRDILWGLKKYNDNEIVRAELMNYFIEELNILKYNVFKLWDIEKYLGYEKNYISALYYYTNTNDFANDYANHLNIFNDLNLIDSLKKNKELFIDLEDNFDLYVNAFIKLSKLDYEDSSFRIFLKFLKVNEIDYRELFEYRELEIKGEKKEIEFIRNYNNDKLMPILKEMEMLIGKLRQQWEEEWKLNKRSYIWKD